MTDATTPNSADRVWAKGIAQEFAARAPGDYLEVCSRAGLVLDEIRRAVVDGKLRVYTRGIAGMIERPARESEPSFPQGDYPLKRDTIEAWFAQQGASAQTAATPAPVVAGGDGPTPLTTGDIAFCFAGLRWGESEWKKPLGDKPKWLDECIVIQGQRGGNERRWNPVLIGAALVHQGHAFARNVRAKFQTVDHLKPWLEAWKTYEADNFNTP